MARGKAAERGQAKGRKRSSSRSSTPTKRPKRAAKHSDSDEGGRKPKTTGSSIKKPSAAKTRRKSAGDKSGSKADMKKAAKIGLSGKDTKFVGAHTSISGEAASNCPELNSAMANNA